MNVLTSNVVKVYLRIRKKKLNGRTDSTVNNCAEWTTCKSVINVTIVYGLGYFDDNQWQDDDSVYTCLSHTTFKNEFSLSFGP